MNFKSRENYYYLTDINRQADITNELYCEYAVERLELCVSLLVDLLIDTVQWI